MRIARSHRFVARPVGTRLNDEVTVGQAVPDENRLLFSDRFISVGEIQRRFVRDHASPTMVVHVNWFSQAQPDLRAYARGPLATRINDEVIYERLLGIRQSKVRAPNDEVRTPRHRVAEDEPVRSRFRSFS